MRFDGAGTTPSPVHGPNTTHTASGTTAPADCDTPSATLACAGSRSPAPATTFTRAG
jgi:hypothetical protein